MSFIIDFKDANETFKQKKFFRGKCHINIEIMYSCLSFTQMIDLFISGQSLMML